MKEINMEEGPLIIAITIINSKQIKVKSNKDKNFTIDIGICMNMFIIDGRAIERNYHSEMNLEKIQKDKYFSMFNNLQEIFTEISSILDKSKPALIENVNSINLSIPLPTTKIKEIIFEIY